MSTYEIATNLPHFLNLYKILKDRNQFSTLLSLPQRMNLSSSIGKTYTLNDASFIISRQVKNWEQNSCIQIHKKNLIYHAPTFVLLIQSFNHCLLTVWDNNYWLIDSSSFLNAHKLNIIEMLEIVFSEWFRHCLNPYWKWLPLINAIHINFPPTISTIQ